MIARIYDLSFDSFAELRAESLQQGFQLLKRLEDDWNSGANTFSAPGEALFAALDGDRVVGVCGLNVDPFTAEPRTGRVRHLYVAASNRRRGIATAPVEAVASAALGNFDRLRLRTRDLGAAMFYERFGFLLVSGDEHCTHWLKL